MPELPPPNDQSLVQLLRLKRHETPPDGYFEELLPRLHTRLRVEMMRRSSASLLLERLGVFFDNLAGGRWVAGGVAAYATALAGALFLLQWSATPDDSAESALQPVSLEANSPVQPQPIRVPFRFNVVPVQPLPADPAAPGATVNKPEQPAAAPLPGER